MTFLRWATGWTALATLTLGLAGCGGGGGGGSVGNPINPAGIGTVTEAVVWPAGRAQARPGGARLQERLVSAAQSAVILLTDSGGHVVSQTQTVTRPAGGGAVTTTFTHLAPGTLNVQAAAYAAPNGTGALLGSATTSVTVVANVTTAAPTLSVSGQITALRLLAALEVAVGKSLTLVPAATDAAGDAALTAPGEFAWTSDTPSVATVDANGVVTGVSPGTAGIKATDSVSGLSASTPVTITGVFTRHYSAMPLGTLGGTLTTATGINDAGQVIGSSSLPGTPVTSHAFRSAGTSLTDLTPSQAQTVSQAFGENASGQVAGEFQMGQGTTHAFLYSGNSLVDLNPYLGGGASVANGVNNSGQVVGSFTSGGGPQAFLYDSAQAGPNNPGPVIPLQEQLSGLMATTSVANAINDSGQIVGSFTKSDGASRAFLLGSGGGDLNQILGASSSSAVAINAGGLVIGTFGTAGGAGHAFLYNSATGAATDLNPLLGASSSSALGLNARGQIVGHFTTPAGTVHAFLYDTDGTVTDLNPFLGGVSSTASGINAGGEICATGVGSNGQSHAFVLTLG